MNIEHERLRNFVKAKPTVKSSVKTKSSLRILYESEVSAIRKKYGDIDQIRTEIDLSQRQFCKLLMVDPSTYNRWKESATGPPPAIWRAISWFMLLREKDPWLSRFFAKTNIVEVEGMEKRIQEISLELAKSNIKVAGQIRQLKWVGVSLLIGIILGYAIHFL